MINVTTGIYQPWTTGVERIGGGTDVRLPATFSGPRANTEMLSTDPERATAISHLANRSLSYKLAVRNLDDVTSYLKEIA